jgi:hypothetical protein
MIDDAMGGICKIQWWKPVMNFGFYLFNMHDIRVQWQKCGVQIPRHKNRNLVKFQPNRSCDG